MTDLKYFTREIEYSKGTLTIYQATIGDVGHVVWDAALALSKYIDSKTFKHKIDIKGRNIIELGAGTGLVGLVAAMIGGQVNVTDLKELLPLLEKNIKENKDLVSNNIKAEVLKWDENIEFPGKIDLILIADCIYYEESLKPLVMTMKNLCSKSTHIYLSYEERTSEHKIQLQKRFFELVEEHFEVQKIPLSEQDPVYSSDDIHIFKMAVKL